jgi:hypothetical protein
MNAAQFFQVRTRDVLYQSIGASGTKIAGISIEDVLQFLTECHDSGAVTEIFHGYRGDRL